jgi:hypothetical protein
MAISGEGIHLREYLKIVVKHRKTVAGFFIITFVLVMLGTFAQTPQYKATTRAIIDMAGEVSANGGGGGGGAGSIQGQDDPCCYDDGNPGEDGALGSSPADGGADVGAWSAAGGRGGTTTQAAQSGSPGGGDGNGGSGGGGAGRVAIQTP